MSSFGISSARRLNVLYKHVIRGALSPCNQQRTFTTHISHNFSSDPIMQEGTSNSIYKVLICPILSDNYSYIIVDEESKKAAIVDPAEPSKVQEYINSLKKSNTITSLDVILTTHKHWDHAGGNLQMIKLYPSLKVYGPSHESDAVPGVNHPVKDGDQFDFGKLEITVLETPCHTRGHVQYYVRAKDGANSNSDEGSLFSGDTFFIGGCGRFFEGDAQQMYHNVQKVKSLLPTLTKLYCGHEYTLKNLEFAQNVDPSNQFLAEKFSQFKNLREKGKPTVPSTLADEFKYNPFMRTDDPTLQKQVGKQGDPIETLRIIRQMKDKF